MIADATHECSDKSAEERVLDQRQRYRGKHLEAVGAHIVGTLLD